MFISIDTVLISIDTVFIRSLSFRIVSCLIFLLPVSPDFQLLNETLVFDADSNSSQCVSFQTSEDDIVEGDDTLNVTALTSPTDQAVNIMADPILVTILNDDSKLNN